MTAEVLPEGTEVPFIQPGAELTPEVLEEQEARMVEVLEIIMEQADEFGASIRALGSIAFRIKCPDYKYMEYENRRYLTDIDFIARSGEIDRVQDMFFSMDWSENQTVLRLFGHKRRIFYHPDLPLHSDVFLDKLRFCHEIDFRKRLELDGPTISVTDLLLEKLQIVEINRKDLIDIMVLMGQYGVSGEFSGGDCIDGDRIASLFGRDWGWWRTGTANIRKTIDLAEEYLAGQDAAAVRKRLEDLLEMVERGSKSIGWRLRSIIGERMKWYNEVEEVERD